jgi:AraC family transcriptional regulator of adaptative response / DNA-3-methyladenine glycosylase II
VVSLSPQTDHVACKLALSDLRDLSIAIARCRRLLDLVADPVAVDGELRADPLLASVVDAGPGRRVPGTADAAEFAVRAVLGQQVSTAAARTHARRLVEAVGDKIEDVGLTHLFPTPSAPADLDPGVLAMPRSRKTAFRALAEAPADGSLDLDLDLDLDLGVGADWAKARADLSALPGFGPRTVEVIAMRALGDPDAFLPTDLGIRIASRALGLPDTPAALVRRAQRWRPWRAYAVQYLWATGDHAVDRLPA